MYVDSLKSASICSFIVNGCSQGANVSWHLRGFADTVRRPDAQTLRPSLTAFLYEAFRFYRFRAAVATPINDIGHWLHRQLT
jgi:hypothetical protein